VKRGTLLKMSDDVPMYELGNLYPAPDPRSARS